MHEEKIHVQKQAQAQSEDSEPRKSFTDTSTLRSPAPKPVPSKPTEDQDRTCLMAVEGTLDSAPKTVCFQQITSRKIIPLGSTYLEVQLKYDHCLENSLSPPWQMSFLSVLNLKERNVLECLENITPYSLP